MKTIKIIVAIIMVFVLPLRSVYAETLPNNINDGMGSEEDQTDNIGSEPEYSYWYTSDYLYYTFDRICEDAYAVVKAECLGGVETLDYLTLDFKVNEVYWGDMSPGDVTLNYVKQNGRVDLQKPFESTVLNMEDSPYKAGKEYLLIVAQYEGYDPEIAGLQQIIPIDDVSKGSFYGQPLQEYIGDEFDLSWGTDAFIKFLIRRIKGEPDIPVVGWVTIAVVLIAAVALAVILIRRRNGRRTDPTSTPLRDINEV